MAQLLSLEVCRRNTSHPPHEAESDYKSIKITQEQIRLLSLFKFGIKYLKMNLSCLDSINHLHWRQLVLPISKLMQEAFLLSKVSAANLTRQAR